jgi:hypothetical protein
MPRVAGGRPVAWEDAGRQIAPLLGSYNTAVVTSSDPVAAAHVALGIARAEAAQRRVVIGDLVGDLAPLRSLVADEDPHGISDSFLYGVSMNKVERPVSGSDNVFIMPSGTEPVIGSEVFASNRWKRVAAGFTSMGALLLLVTRSDSPGLAELIEQLDGAVLVKEIELAAAPAALIIARVTGPTRTLKIPLLLRSAGAARWPRKKWLYPGIAALAVVVAGTIALLLIAGNGAARRTAAVNPRVPARAVVPASQPRPIASDSVAVAPPVNPLDSAAASAFAVLLVIANTPDGANLQVRKDSLLPSITLAPVPIGAERTTWYRVIAGAYTRRDQADSLLLALRNSRMLGDSAGNVLKAPLALLVDSVPTQGGIDDVVRSAIGKYRTRGLPVYALMQKEGGALLYAGAFERAAQSAELTRTLRGAGLHPVLAYRIGRAP